MSKITKTRPKTKALASVHEAAHELFAAGAINKHTLAHFTDICLGDVVDFSPPEIKAVRERTGVSQSRFARHLNVSTITISQWERGERKPSGTALKLLQLVKTKGLAVLV